MNCKNLSDTQLLHYMGTDGQKWAQEFIEIIKEKPQIALDEGMMIGWFANAIMAGHDAAVFKENKSYEVKMSDEEILDFLGKYRIDGSLKYDLLRHRLMLLNIYLNPFCKQKHELPMIKAWIRRLKNIRKYRKSYGYL